MTPPTPTLTPSRPARWLRQLVFVAGMLLLGTSLSACIIEDGHGHRGGCFWHRC
jgi:hypothetical protein